MQQKELTITWFYPHLKFWMGGTKYLYEMTTRLTGTGKFGVDIYCNGGTHSILDSFRHKGVQIHEISPISTNSFAYWITPFCILYDLVRSYFMIKKGSVCIATLYPSNFIASIISRLHGRNYIYLCYEPFPFFHDEKFIMRHPPAQQVVMRIISFFNKRLDEYAVSKAHEIIVLDEVKAEMVKSVYKRTSIVIPVGVDTQHFYPRAQNSSELFKKYGKFFIHSTDYTELKRTDLVLKAYQKATNQNNEFSLVITSTQPDSPNKVKYINLAKSLNIDKRVHFVGLLEYSALPVYYSNAICYLSGCTDKATAGNWPVKEALACGTPAIRSPIQTDDVTDGMTGFIVDLEDADKYSEKIREFIKDPDLKEKMSQSCVEAIRSKYSWDKSVEQLSMHLNDN